MLKPSSLFGNGAVLCREKEIRVFGEADSGSEVRVSLKNCHGDILAENVSIARDGRFEATLMPQKAETGCSLIFTAGPETVTAGDILIGDVYLAGGQSNMELSLWTADEGRDLIGAHDDPLLRYYNVPQRAVVNEEQRTANENACWTPIRPGNGGDMSAVAYFFAKKAREENGVPVGIIDCYWGGTSVTCWMDEETLRKSAEGTRFLDDYSAVCGGKDMAAFTAEENAWKLQMDQWNREVERYRNEHADAAWTEVEEQCGKCPWNPPAGPGSPYRPAGLAESMVKPVSPAALTAILFYQGETDAGATDCYGELLTDMVSYWRGLFRDQEIPFLYVQLPVWLEEGKEDTGTWPVIRKAQAEARKTIPYSGMICLLDQGEFNNLHPTRKRVVGERLWEQAKMTVFGLPGKQAPRAIDLRTDGNRLTVILDHPVSICGNEPLTEIAGQDGIFRPAEAIVKENELILTAEAVPEPRKARYAWTDYAKAAFFGENGYPLEPFDL